MNRLQIIVLFLLFGLSNTANAHEIINKGTAILMIHIEPGHTVAVAGQPVVINLDLTNAEKSFSLEKCDCELTIEKDEKVLLSTALVPVPVRGEFNVVGTPFTFPREGEYHLTVEGDPKTLNLFAPFEIEGHIEVLPAGTVLPSNLINYSHVHTYPRIMLGVVTLFTVWMGYCLFSNRDPLARLRRKKR